MTVPGQDDTPVFMWGRREYQYAGENLGSGNRCGHDPQRLAADRLALPEVNGGHRLKTIDHLIEKAQTYFRDPASVPSLAYLSGKSNRDGSPRQNRSEGREAQALILSAILCVMDYSSLRVGQPKRNGQFRNFTFDEIAAMCGLVDQGDDGKQTPVACSRFRRGVEWLKNAGAIEVFEQYEETAEGKRGRPAIKTVSEKFLMVLGRLSKLHMKRFRDKATKSMRDWRNGAVQAGIQQQSEYDDLNGELRSARANKVAFPKVAVKNLTPRTVTPDNGADALQADWAAYSELMQAKIIDAHGGVQPRGKAYMDAYKRAGGLDQREWMSRRSRQ